jgi:hypothetical protein
MQLLGSGSQLEVFFQSPAVGSIQDGVYNLTVVVPQGDTSSFFYLAPFVLTDINGRTQVYRPSVFLTNAPCMYFDSSLC